MPPGSFCLIQFLIAGDHRQANSVAVSARHESLEHLLRRQRDFGGHRLRREIVGINVVLPQLVANPQLVEQSRSICFGRHS